MIIVDTNVVSELMKPAPHVSIQEWIRTNYSRRLYATAVTIAEIRYGIIRLPIGRRKDLLTATADSIFSSFGSQILPFDEAAAIQYPLVVNARDQIGRPINGFDTQIAAICRAHGVTLATRNIKDFEQTGIEVINPWLVEDQR